MFRPAFMQPTKGLKNAYMAYRMLAPIFPMFKLLFPNYVLTLREVGLAMINSVEKVPDKRVLEAQDIARLAQG